MPIPRVLLLLVTLKIICGFCKIPARLFWWELLIDPPRYVGMLVTFGFFEDIMGQRIKELKNVLKYHSTHTTSELCKILFLPAAIGS